MTKYEDANGYVSDNNIKKYVTDECEMHFTDEPQNALYILRDGSMIDGTDEYGDRCEDHRMITDLISEGKDYYTNDRVQNIFWEQLHAKTGLIRLCPESNEALIGNGQPLTTSQQRLCDMMSYDVEPYTDPIHMVEPADKTAENTINEKESEIEAD